MALLSHIPGTQARMVDIKNKIATERLALVKGRVRMSQKWHEQAESFTAEQIREIQSVAKTAGLLASKNTSHLIPHCHPIALDFCDIEIRFDELNCEFSIICRAQANAATGVEMEAFVAAQIAALTIYDMIKSSDAQAKVGPFFLSEKYGGKKGHWISDND